MPGATSPGYRRHHQHLAGRWLRFTASIGFMEIFNCPVSPCGRLRRQPTATATRYNHAYTCVANTLGEAAADAKAAPTPHPRPRRLNGDRLKIKVIRNSRGNSRPPCF